MQQTAVRGLGAPGSISSRAARRPCQARATLAPLERPAPAPQKGPASRGVTIPDAASPEALRQLVTAQAQPSTSGRVVMERPEELRSTLEHRLWVGGTSVMLGGILASGLAEVHDAGSAAVAVASALAAYVAADFGSAVFHWAVDNYGDGSTPVFGSQIAAFQGHHQRPWTITEREFCNNVHQVFRPAAPFAALLLAASPSTPAALDVFASTFIALVCLSQQFHAWSHMKKSELPAAVVALQDAGLVISRKDHGAHHKAPFTAKYSIVSGWVNPLLDGDCPENSVWRKAEEYIRDRTGVEPRCWHDVLPDWVEQQRPSA